MKTNKKYFLLSILFCFICFPVFSQNMYLEINLNESRNNNMFDLPVSHLEIFRVIERAGNDAKINGIILNIGSINRGRNYLWELRKSLEQFKANDKKIVAFISNANIDTYTLATAADTIVMDDLGQLSMLGYSINALYAKEALERLGIGVQEFRYYEYKTAAEMFVRDSMSEAERMQLNDYLDDIFNDTRVTLMNARGWTLQEFNTIINSEFLFSPNNALNRNIIDRIGRKDAVLEAVNEAEGKKITKFLLWGNTGTSLTGTSLTYKPPRLVSVFKKNTEIAVVYANGQTDMEKGMSAVTLSKTIKELADNKQVRAILLRINSPGGSAEAADYIDEAVRYAKQKKPVVVSMGQVAASGGYWAAMNANHIIATPFTITGSIGVIGTWFYDNGLNSKLGIAANVLKRGESSDLSASFLFPYRNLTNHEEERYKIFITDIYKTFTEKVAAGRDMNIEDVEAVAQGRIFSGTRALDAGLIDSIGSLNDALHIARQLAGIPENTTIVYTEYPKPTFRDLLFNSFPVLLRIFGKNNQPAASEILDMLLPSDIRYRLEHNGQIMPIMPLTMNIQ